MTGLAASVGWQRPTRGERFILALTLASLAVWGIGFEMGRLWTPWGVDLAWWTWSEPKAVWGLLGTMGSFVGWWHLVDLALFAVMFLGGGILGWIVIRFLPAPWLILACRLYLGYVFIDASIEKILYPQVFATSMVQYDLFPHFLVNLASLWLPWLELLAGVGLVLGLQARLMGLIFVGMLGWFLFAIIVNIFRGNSFDCGCGTAGDDALGWGVVWRDVYMAFIALSIFLFDRGFLAMDRLFQRKR
jgi:uncharacterized membrane protein YphA (DoxX/SURF4 family)